MSVDIWATAELCISIIVVALIALRPLLQKLTRMIASSLSGSHDASENRRSGMVKHSRRNNWNFESPFPAGFPGVGSGSSGSRLVTTKCSNNPMGSEVELTGRGIVRTKEVSVHSEPAVNQGGDCESTV